MSESERSGNDSATGKSLPKGVWYRGAGQYQAPKMVDGKRLRKTFASSALARRWLTEKRAEVDLRQFKDTSSLDKTSLRRLVERYLAAHTLSPLKISFCFTASFRKS